MCNSGSSVIPPDIVGDFELDSIGVPRHPKSMPICVSARRTRFSGPFKASLTKSWQKSAETQKSWRADVTSRSELDGEVPEVRPAPSRIRAGVAVDLATVFTRRTAGPRFLLAPF